jgi:protein O-mannosyl-transferase
MGKSSRKKKTVKQQVQPKQARLNAGQLPWWNDKSITMWVGGILLLTLIIYSPTFQNEWTNWDDDLYVAENPLVRSLSSDNIARIFDSESFIAGNYHPVTILSLAINYHFSGENITAYQWTNILLHLLNTLLVFLFIFELTKGKKEIAIITALLFAVHPMHVESVSWMAERKDVLYTVFFLLGLISYLKYVRKNDFIQYGLALAFFIISILAKPAAVVFPVCLILIDFFIKRKWNTKSMLDKILFFGVSLLSGLHTITAQTAASAYGGLDKFSIYERLMISSYGFIMYIVRFIVPVKLAAFYPYPIATNPYHVFIPDSFLFFLILSLAIGALTIWSIKRTRVIAFGMLFYLITVALVLQFVSVGDAILADRYTYVPYIGLGFLAGFAIYQYFLKKGALYIQYKNIALGILGVVTVVFSFLTYNQTKTWKSTETLFTNVIQYYPKAVVAYNNRGHYYRQRNELEKALADYNKALTINPKYHLALSNKGKVYFEYKDYDKALENYSLALKYKPDDVASLTNRAAVYGLKNQYDLALKDLEKSVELDSNYYQAYFNRSILYSNLRRWQDCINDCSKYLEYNPRSDGILNSRGVAYMNLGDFNSAIRDFSEAIRLKPNQGIYYMNRSYSYKNSGNTNQAISDIQQARRLGINIDPSYLRSLGIQ